MGKMGKRYLVFDGRTMPVLKKKEQQTTTTKEEGTGQAKEGSAKEGSAVDKSDTGGMEVATMKSGLLPQQHFFQRIEKTHRAFLHMAQVSV